MKEIKKYYVYLRHGVRVHINFARNYLLLKRIRLDIKRRNNNKRLIAIMLLEHLGDIVACEPIVRHIKSKDSKAYIIWGVKRAYRELIDDNPYIDMTLPIHCLTERMMLIKTGIFDEVIDLHFPDRYCSLCRRPIHKEKNDSDINLTNYFHYGSLLSAMAQSAGLPALDVSPQVYIPQRAVKKVDTLGLPSEFIAINCTSNAIEKGWPRDKWKLLLKQIQEKYHIPAYEIGLTSFVRNHSVMFKSLCGKLSILESAEVIRRAKLFIGIDSGPAHLANAVGTPGIVLIGNYLGFSKYNPFSGGYGNGTNSKLLYSNNLVNTIFYETVSHEIDLFMSNKY